MVDDPYTYDLSEFATEFTWGMLFWNLAEMQARQMLSWMLGGEMPAMAIVADMGNRSVIEGIEAAARELGDASLRDHLGHFSKGFGTLLSYRNQYVHGMVGVNFGDTVGMNKKLLGTIMQIKGNGRLKSINRTIDLVEMRAFTSNGKALSRYGSAIETELGIEDWSISEILRMPRPSLEKPTWPSALQNTPSYLQD